MMLAAAAHSQGVTWPDVALAAVIVLGIVAVLWVIFEHSFRE